MIIPASPDSLSEGSRHLPHACYCKAPRRHRSTLDAASRRPRLWSRSSSASAWSRPSRIQFPGSRLRDRGRAALHSSCSRHARSCPRGDRRRAGETLTAGGGVDRGRCHVNEWVALLARQDGHDPAARELQAPALARCPLCPGFGFRYENVAMASKNTLHAHQRACFLLTIRRFIDFVKVTRFPGSRPICRGAPVVGAGPWVIRPGQRHPRRFLRVAIQCARSRCVLRRAASGICVSL